MAIKLGRGALSHKVIQRFDQVILQAYVTNKKSLYLYY